MYHIKSDRRSLRTAEEIVRGLQECLKEKPLASVSVTDIHRATGISRATFYRLFDTTSDVLEYICDRQPQEDLDLVFRDPALDARALYTQLLEMGLKNHDFLKALVENGRYDLVYRYAERRFRLLNSLRPDMLPRMEEGSYDYLIASLAMMMVSTLVTWVKRGRRDTPEQISEFTREGLLTLLTLTGSQGAEGEKTDPL